ncbi:hypothetical protein AAI421_14415 [Rhodococcus aetherivorans]|uniref:hypothetical protein n=1 Tax=Rhodococcus aetherivorans TaxID=191292 RepID=UPI0031E1A373
MTFAEIRKGVIAVLGAIVAVVPQVLASLAGVIPAHLASWLTIIASVCTAVLVYLVPNEKRNVTETVQYSVQGLEPALEQLRQRVLRESAEAWQPALDILRNRIPGSGESTRFGDYLTPKTARTPDSESQPAPDPFVVPPVGR